MAASCLTCCASCSPPDAATGTCTFVRLHVHHLSAPLPLALDATLQRVLDTPLRLVLDTNIWLDWLVFKDAGMARLKAAQQSGDVEIIHHLAGEQELARVLDYQAIKPLVGATLKDGLLAEMRRVSRLHDGTTRTGRLPVCRDADDQTYLELARDCGADFLVTKDRDLLALKRAKFGVTGFKIVTPAECTTQITTQRTAQRAA